MKRHALALSAAFFVASFPETVKIFPGHIKLIGNYFEIMADEINHVVNNLNKYKNTQIKGDVEFPDELFNAVLNVFSTVVQEYRQISINVEGFVSIFSQNGKHIRMTSTGDFYLPPAVGPKILQMKTVIMNEFENLQTICRDSQDTMRQASQLLASIKNKEGTTLFNEFLQALQAGVSIYGNVADDINHIITSFSKLGFADSTGQTLISGNAVAGVLNAEMRNIGHEYSIMAGRVD